MGGQTCSDSPTLRSEQLGDIVAVGRVTDELKALRSTRIFMLSK